MEYDEDNEWWICTFEELKDRVLTSIEVHNEPDEPDPRIIFRTDTGYEFKMYHKSKCCEDVYIESIVGDVANLLNHHILIAELVTSDTAPPIKAPQPEYWDAEEEGEWDGTPESYTWSFYKLATIKGYVDIRWFGKSNGYYSETVQFICTVNPDDRNERS